MGMLWGSLRCQGPPTSPRWGGHPRTPCQHGKNHPSQRCERSFISPPHAGAAPNSQAPQSGQGEDRGHGRGSLSGSHLLPKGHRGIRARQGTASPWETPPGRSNLPWPGHPCTPQTPHRALARGSLPPVPACSTLPEKQYPHGSVARHEPGQGGDRTQPPAAAPCPAGTVKSSSPWRSQCGGGPATPGAPQPHVGVHTCLCRCWGTMAAFTGAATGLRVCRTGRSGRW